MKFEQKYLIRLVKGSYTDGYAPVSINLISEGNMISLYSMVFKYYNKMYYVEYIFKRETDDFYFSLDDDRSLECPEVTFRKKDRCKYRYLEGDF